MRLAVIALSLPLLLCGCTSEPSPSISPGLTTDTPPSPTIRPSTTEPTGLRVGGMATITVGGLARMADPENPSSQPELNEQYGQLSAGDRVFLVDGPWTIDGLDYWQLYPSYWHGSNPLGWARATRANGRPTMEPYQPPCPADDQPSLDELLGLDGLERLACFGDRELVLHGTVTCDRPIVDSFIGGAPWMSSNRHCSLDGRLALGGEALYELLESPERVERISGRYEVRGHFDDAGARHCHSIPLGMSLESRGQGEPGPVMECRQRFVVTGVTPID